MIVVHITSHQCPQPIMALFLPPPSLSSKLPNLLNPFLVEFRPVI
jgi:hypothetical protein